MKDKKIKWGILGTGIIAKLFAAGLKDAANAELYAVGSRSKEKAENFAKEFNIKKAYGSYDKAVSDPEVDIIYIATPHHLHSENTLMSLENNKHVLCEKPFGINGREAREMIAKAEEKKLFLMEAMWSRFLPNILKAKEIVESGAIGKVKLITAYFGLKSQHTPQQRHFNKDMGGGSLLDIGIYPVFLSLFILGKPDSFTATAGIGPTGVDNTISITFKYGSDVLSIMYSTLISNPDTVAEIHGEKGKIIFDKWWFTPVNIKTVDLDGNESHIPLEFKGNGYNYEAEEAGNCILSGKIQSDKMSWKESLQLIDMLDAVRKECGIVYPKHDGDRK